MATGYERLSRIDRIRILHAKLSRLTELLSALDLVMDSNRTEEEVMELASYRWERISRETVATVDRIMTESEDDRTAEAGE